MRPIPTIAKAPPLNAQGRSSIMGLEAGHATNPIPCPIQSRPINVASTPTTINAIFIRFLLTVQTIGPGLSTRADLEPPAHEPFKGFAT
jgi:hypothetical protein